MNELKRSQEALTNWLTAWKKRDFNKMFALSQVSWRGQEHIVNGIVKSNDPYLKRLYKDVELLDFEILMSDSIEYGDKKEKLDPNVILQYYVVCKIFYKKISIVKDEIRVINIIQETKDGTAVNEEGTWGVNPNSALRKFKDDFLEVQYGKTKVEDLKARLGEV